MTADLSDALRLHQAGKLNDAARAYNAVLARQKDNPDALHLLGVVAHQQGRYADAVELISKALARAPQAAPYHANLAEAYRALGQLNRAVQSGRTALRFQPQFPEAQNNLGLALRAQGQLDDAIRHFRAAVAARPAFAMARNNLADCLREKGRADEALAELRQAVAANPNLAEAHSNLGQMLLERQQFEEALAHCSAAVQLRPNLPEARNNLGNVLREIGKQEEARAEYQAALKLNPNLGQTYANVAITFQEQGKFDEARQWYDKALERDPASGRVRAHLGSLAQATERWGEAEQHYRLAVQFDPNYAPTHNSLGFVLHQLGRDQESLACYRAALKLNPSLVAAHVNMGDLLEELGQFPEAEASFRAALKLNPNHGGALGQLATMLRGKLPVADRDHMRKLVQNPRANRRINLLHGLAHALDAGGEYDEAAQLLEEGNRLRAAELAAQGKAYNPDEHRKFVDRIVNTFTPEYFARYKDMGLSTLRPVFVLGLPRSATTLTEQIIASHSQAYGAGELRLARDVFTSAAQGTGTNDTVFATLPRLERSAVRQCAQHHLDQLLMLAPTAARIVDKMPDNYLYLGFLAVMFPKARFIHTRRDLRDVAVSCWMTNFKSIRWACDQHHIATRFNEYARVMDHWRKVLPVPLLEIDYADTVADLPGTARKLIDWVGLEWEDGCLAFHESKGPIRTASVSQVRQPIYTRSVARWKHYEKSLAPLFGQLPPV